MRAAGSSAGILLRLGLAVVAFALLWLMDGAMLNYQTEYQATLSFPVGTWLGMVAFGALAGAAFAGAARVGEWGGPYRWGVALALAALPLAVLLLNYLFLAGVLQGMPGWLASLLGDMWLATSAVLLGVAGISGVSAPAPTPGSGPRP